MPPRYNYWALLKMKHTIQEEHSMQRTRTGLRCWRTEKEPTSRSPTGDKHQPLLLVHRGNVSSSHWQVSLPEVKWEVFRWRSYGRCCRFYRWLQMKRSQLQLRLGRSHSHIFFIYFYLCMGVLSACMSMYSLYVWYPWRPREGTRIPGAGL